MLRSVSPKMPRPRIRPLRWTIPRRPLGAHMSISGGLEKAIERGLALGCTAIQLFTKSNNQWAARPIAADEARRFGGEVVPLDVDPRAAGMTGLVHRFPVGPISAITPFNFPLNLLAHQVAPAIAVGTEFDGYVGPHDHQVFRAQPMYRAPALSAP